MGIVIDIIIPIFYSPNYIPNYVPNFAGAPPAFGGNCAPAIYVANYVAN